MKKQRLIRELLIILRDNEKLFIDQECTGLCWLVYKLWREDLITREEGIEIDNFIKEKCDRNKRYYFDGDTTNQPFFFPISEWPPRKAWLDRWIKKLNK